MVYVALQVLLCHGLTMNINFHLVLNLEEVQNYEYPELVEVLEKMIQRIKVQQTLVNTQGVAQLRLEDEVKPINIDEEQDQV